MSMLRSLDRGGALTDVTHLHSARTADDVIFGRVLRDLARRSTSFRLHEQLTSVMGRIGPGDLDRLCPDWRERETFLSGPVAMLDATSDYFKAELGHCDRLHLEHFQPYLDGAAGEKGAGGAIRFCSSDLDALSDGGRADSARGRAGRRDTAVRLPDGDLSHLCRAVAFRPGPRPAHR